MTIQVTALLSAVARCICRCRSWIRKAATLSDQAFVFAYMILSVMIGISILRINPRIGDSKAIERVLEILHITLVPAFIAAGVYYVYGLSSLSS